MEIATGVFLAALFGVSVVLLTLGHRIGIDDKKKVAFIFSLSSLIFVGFCVLLDMKENIRGTPADMTTLRSGIYAVLGKMASGHEILLWLAPPDSPKDFRHGRLYRLNTLKGGKDLGPFLQKHDNGEISPFVFEK